MLYSPFPLRYANTWNHLSSLKDSHHHHHHHHHHKKPKTYGFLTKGDNSPYDDTVLYPPRQRYLHRGDIVGAVKGHIPYIGRAALVVGEYPWIRQGILLISALSCVMYEIG